MSDNRSVWARAFQRDPRWHDVTAKGKLINMSARLIIVLTALFMLFRLLPDVTYAYGIGLVACLTVTIPIFYSLDQYTFRHWTYAAEKKRLDRKVVDVKKTIV